MSGSVSDMEAENLVSNCTVIIGLLNISQPGSQNIQKLTINMSHGGNKCKISYKKNHNFENKIINDHTAFITSTKMVRDITWA